jgi:hypothetical protein
VPRWKSINLGSVATSPSSSSSTSSIWLFGAGTEGRRDAVWSARQPWDCAVEWSRVAAAITESRKGERLTFACQGIDRTILAKAPRARCS